MKQKNALGLTTFLTIALTVGITIFASNCGNPDQAAPEIIHQLHLSQAWHPQKKHRLEQKLINDAKIAETYFSSHRTDQPKILIVPHAALTYSGIAAASSYNNIGLPAEKNSFYDRIIILAPSHAIAFSGIGTLVGQAYQTPLGTIKIDQNALETLAKRELFAPQPEAHQHEHSLEMQLIQLAARLKNSQVIPLIIGSLSAKEIQIAAQELQELIDPKTLMIVTSDLTHYGSSFCFTPFIDRHAARLKNLDSQAIEAIMSTSPHHFSKLLSQTKATICGATPIQILLTMIQNNAFGPVEPSLDAYYASPHITSLKEHQPTGKALCKALISKQLTHSVSYAGISFYEKQKETVPPTGYEQQALLALARTILEHAFSQESDQPVDLMAGLPIMTPLMETYQGAFVTLHTKNGHLRGCIGYTSPPNQPLYQSIIQLVQSAAFNDHRFSPLKPEELDTISIEISILTPPKQIPSPDKINVINDGIILTKLVDGTKYSSVYLPGVAAGQGWTLKQALTSLSKKAGLEDDAWRSGATFATFSSIAFHE